MRVVRPTSINLKECLACGEQNLVKYLDLGRQPLANNFCSSLDELEEYPLQVHYCANCFHSQLGISVNPHILFGRYLYVSSTSQTLLDYFSWLVNEIKNTFPTSARILDLASNDGSFLKIAKDEGFQVLGIDPAANLIELAAKNGVPTLCDYWPGSNSNLFQNKFDCIVAMNVFAHVPNPLEFLQAARDSLKENGRIYIQTSQSRMFVNGEFDTVYHEHLSFFTARSMRHIAQRTGLRIIEGRYVPVHGTSYLWTLTHSNNEKNNLENMTSIEQQEIREGVYDELNFLRYKTKVEEIASKISKIVSDFKGKGYEIWSYGAAAKGNTFINFAKIKLDGIIDDNPLKQGLYSPGGRVKVSSNEVIPSLPERTLFIVPAWNLVEEIELKLKLIRNFNFASLLTYYPAIKVREFGKK